MCSDKQIEDQLPRVSLDSNILEAAGSIRSTRCMYICQKGVQALCTLQALPWRPLASEDSIPLETSQAICPRAAHQMNHMDQEDRCRQIGSQKTCLRSSSWMVNAQKWLRHPREISQGRGRSHRGPGSGMVQPEESWGWNSWRGS